MMGVDARGARSRATKDASVGARRTTSCIARRRRRRLAASSSSSRAEEIADALAQMHARDRYNEVLFLADTCQAATLAKAIRSPRVLALSSISLWESLVSCVL